jgi:chemotaxis protein methyltransferase CheR
VIQDPDYKALKDHLIAATGLSYYCDRNEDFGERIRTRLSELGLPDCSAYSALLDDERKGPAERDIIVARLNIGETYFFRDQEQLDAIRDVVIPEILERNQSSRQLRIWSAGCANGSEPYSLSILLERELSARLAGWQVSILATDISRPALAEAARGKYGEWALRSTSEEQKKQCFFRDGDGWTLRPEYRKGVSFAKVNLADTHAPGPLKEAGGFDLILCRNVMIYFSPELKGRLIKRFRESLANGGWLIVGAVEHDLENFKCFRAVAAPGATLYQALEPPKPVNPVLVAPAYPRNLSASLANGPATSPPVVNSPRLEARHSVAAAAKPGIEHPDIEGLRRLANRGDWQSAVPYCHQLLALDGLNPKVHFYHALVLDHIGVAGDAERSLRHAIYLDRHFLLAHYHLGLVLTKEQKSRPAARSFENVLTLSSKMHDHEPVVDGDGVTVAGLKDLARMHLHNLGAL